MNFNIVKKIYRKKDIDNIKNKITLLGGVKKAGFDAESFLSIRNITTILLSIILILMNVKYILIPFILIIYYNLFYYLLITNRINKRILKLDCEALTFFEILAITLEAGKNLEDAIYVTTNNIESELSSEFKSALLEIKYGKTLYEALEGLNKKIPSENINNIILNITQTSVFGNSIVETMNNQVNFLREKQIMKTKEEINKIPNKVSIISVIFIIPLILLIILGPFIISLLG